MKHSTPPPVKGQDVGYGGKRSKTNYVKKPRDLVNWIITTDWPTEGCNPSFQVEEWRLLTYWSPSIPGVMNLISRIFADGIIIAQCELRLTAVLCKYLLTPHSTLRQGDIFKKLTRPLWA